MKPWPYSRLLAHRGGGSLAPENTLAAIRLGQSLGYRTHEIDVKLTLDGELVLLHDPTLERTTTGHGRAADLTLAELKRLDAGAWHSEAFRGETIPTFAEATALFRSKGTQLNIEIKPTPGFDVETAHRAAEATARLWDGAQVPPLFSSFSFEAMMAAREAAPHIPRAWLVSQFTDADWKRLERIEAIAVHTNAGKITPETIARIRDRGYQVLVYTVNEPEQVRQVAPLVDCVCTDNLRELAQLFPEWR
jgi:glycerophosphoryl diester phosphodiesterase